MSTHFPRDSSHGKAILYMKEKQRNTSLPDKAANIFMLSREDMIFLHVPFAADAPRLRPFLLWRWEQLQHTIKSKLQLKYKGVSRHQLPICRLPSALGCRTAVSTSSALGLGFLTALLTLLVASPGLSDPSPRTGICCNNTGTMTIRSH